MLRSIRIAIPWAPSLNWALKPNISIRHKLYKSILSRKTKRGTTDKTSRDNIRHREIHDLLKSQHGMSLDSIKIPEHLIHKYLFMKNYEDVHIDGVKVLDVTNEGEGLAIVRRQRYDSDASENDFTVVTIPKTVPGDIVTVSLRRHHMFFAEAELILVSRKSRKQSRRNDRLVVCKHFSKCSGCQLQMLSYEDQLQFKKRTIEKAYRYFFPQLFDNLPSNFAAVMPSPMQFAYRTKLTPHAQVPKGLKADDLPLPVGFLDVRAMQPVVDVDSCAVASPEINMALPREKARFNEDLVELIDGSKKKVDPTFVLRLSIRIDHNTGEFEDVCLTKRKNVVTEKVDEYVFQLEANEFFQNNRSILPILLDYIRCNVKNIDYNYIVDAYCGCGFLGIGLSSTLPDEGKLFGIEIALKAIKYAAHNAKINGLHIPTKAVFVEGNSDEMFKMKEFAECGAVGEEALVLMNPSRKGSTPAFMKQLLEFRPKAIVYISCNPFTQARDLADFEALQRRSTTKYRIKALTGFDFYPQTKHVESVAILELIE